jgi:hypothetical protein
MKTTAVALVGAIALICSSLASAQTALDGARKTQSAVVTARSRLLEPLDVWIELPDGYAGALVVTPSVEPVFADSPVDHQYVQQFMHWEELRAADGRRILHLTSQMGFREPLFRLDVVSAQSGDQRLEVVIALPAPEQADAGMAAADDIDLGACHVFGQSADGAISCQPFGGKIPSGQ